MTGLMRTVAAYGAALVLICGAAAPAPAGFRSAGTIVVRATIGGSPLNVGGNIALYRRGTLYRLDLLSLGFPGTNSTTSAVAGALLAPGGATLLYDGSTGTVTAYATGNHSYYQAQPKTAAAASTPAAAQPSGGADPLATLATVARQLHDVSHAAIQLTGHAPVNGHPADNLDVTLQRQLPGKPLEDYHAQVSLAEDLGSFPLRIALQSTPPTPQDFGGALQLDLTSIAPDTPDDAFFALPAGLTRVDSIGAVLQAGH